MKIEGSTFLLTLLRAHYGRNEEHPVRRAVLEATYFIDPAVVAQTKFLPIVRARRMSVGERKNSVVGGEFVSDNFPPDYVFRAAMSDMRDQGSTQLCHIYGGNGEARDSFFYTNLANLCLMPSFLAKFADTDQAVVDLLKECAYVLFGFDPTGTQVGREKTPGLREQIKTATPPRSRICDALTRKIDARFCAARAAGFIFSADGAINTGDPWVSEMLVRREQPSRQEIAPRLKALAAT